MSVDPNISPLVRGLLQTFGCGLCLALWDKNKRDNNAGFKIKEINII